MHVLVLPTEAFLTEQEPLGGIFQWHQVKVLQQGGVRTGVLSVGFRAGRQAVASYPYVRKEVVSGIPIIRCYARVFWPDHRVPVSGLVARYRRLALAVYEKYAAEYGRPDLLHAHNFRHAALLARALNEVHGVPYVVTEHSSEYLRGGYDLRLLPVLVDCAKRASSVSAVSDVLAKKLKPLFELGRVEVLHNVLDPLYLTSAPIRPSHPRDLFSFLSIGTLDENKDHETLIRAFAAHFKGHAVILKIGGEGPLREHLQYLATALGVAGQVSFQGFLTREEVRQEMEAADAFVLPSRFETFGVVLIEAMYFGLPLISTQSGGPEGIIGETNGMLVPVGDVQALGVAMTRMLESHHRYDPAIQSREAVERFGANAFLIRAKSIYARAFQ